MRIRFFATLRPIVGGRDVDLPLEDGVTVRELAEYLVDRWPELGELLLEPDGTISPRVHVFVDGRSARHLPAGTDTRLFDGQEIDVSPAVAGG